MRTAATHRHRPVYTRTTCFNGPVRSQRQNQAAHGGICEIAVCRCGAERRTNINQSFVERGAWYASTPATAAGK